MKILTTGSTGYIGSAVTRELIERGHAVTALVREGTDASRLEGMGATILRGDLSDLPGLRDIVEEHPTAIHMAAAHGDDAIDLDLKAIDGLLAGEKERHVIYTSGVWVFGSTGENAADEASPLDPLPIVYWRPGHESLVLQMSREGITGAVIRPGCVYGHEESLLRGWFESIENGKSVEIAGDGENCWAMIHLDDLARLYAAVAEQRLEGIFHGTDSTRMSLNEIAVELGKPLGKDVETSHTPHFEVMQSMGGFGEALMVDQQVSSEVTRMRTGWSPEIDSLGDVTERLWHEWREARI